ncbi:MAG TPA: glycosyltransferase family 39 protein [Planctomycetia bacterium]|nr:glycosyltransferase family 39 protein [Planctomycetia bacterium]
MHALAAGQDEDYFSVPGLAILRGGPPAIPYVPSRDPAGVFFRADESLFSLPPAFFYLEAVAYSLFESSVFFARCVSLLAGLAAAAAVCLLAERWFPNRHSGLWAALLFLFSRPFLFPATTARPDILCAALLLWTAVIIEYPRFLGSLRRQLFAGLLLGFALLAHPFAVVGAVLFAGAILIPADRAFSFLHRVRTGLVFAIAALLAFSLWLPLILRHPDLFQAQFGNNVVRRAGPGLLERFLSPWESLAVQLRQFRELAGDWQAALFAVALLVVAAMGFRSRSFRPAVFAGAAALLLVVAEGTHTSKGYWCFPIGFLAACAGGAIASLGRVSPFAGLVAFALLLPGSGLRASYVYFQHRGDPDYVHPIAVGKLLVEIPPGARYLVDVGSVFEFHRAGRDTTLALEIAPFFQAKGLPYDYLVVTRTGREQRLPEVLGAGRLVRRIGDPADPYRVFVEVWAP